MVWWRDEIRTSNELLRNYFLFSKCMQINIFLLWWLNGVTNAPFAQLNCLTNRDVVIIFFSDICNNSAATVWTWFHWNIWFNCERSVHRDAATAFYSATNVLCMRIFCIFKSILFKHKMIDRQYVGSSNKFQMKIFF